MCPDVRKNDEGVGWKTAVVYIVCAAWREYRKRGEGPFGSERRER